MGTLSDFFLTDGSATPEYDCGPGFPAEDRCQFKSISPLEAAGILAVLRGGGDPVEMLDDFPLLTPPDAEEWTMSVPVEMATRLAAIDDSQMPHIAQQCADVTVEELGWSAKDFEYVINELRTLARRAVATGKSMYLWNSL